MQDIKEIESRDSESNANTKICFEVQSTALHPRLHREGIQLSTIESSTHGPLLRNYSSTSEYTTLSLYNTNLYIRGGTKQRKKYNLVIIKSTNNCDLKGSQIIFSQNKDPKDRIRIE